MADLFDALSDICEALGADGYELDIGQVHGGKLRLSIIATAGACEECLVPKHLMRMMIEQTLPPEAGVREIELCYPQDEC